MWGVLLAEVVWDGVPASLVIWLIILTSPLPVLCWVHTRLGYSRTTQLLLLLAGVAVLYMNSVVGFGPGAALMSNTLVLLATLLFGDKSFRWALAACLAMIALSWFLHFSNLSPTDTARLSDPNSPLVWLRHALVLGFFAAASRDISRDVRRLERETLLSAVGAVFASSLEVQRTLSEVSRHVVQQFADLFVIDLVEGPASRRLLVTARDPANAGLADALRECALAGNVPYLDDYAARTSRPAIVNVTRDALKGRKLSAEHSALLQALSACSIVRAPVTLDGSTSGVLLAISRSHVYDEQDLSLLALLASRIGMAVESTALHAAVQKAHADTQARVIELEQARRQIQALTGLLPVCAWCGRIRDDHGQWKPFDRYVTEHTNAAVSHSICPKCAAQVRSAGPGRREID